LLKPSAYDVTNLGKTLKAKGGELDDALTLLWDALRIRKLQEDHIKVSETLKNIGNVHREKAELELAIECYEECLRIRRAQLGPDHEKVADGLIAMGNILNDMQRNEEAMQSYQEALKIRSLVFGEVRKLKIYTKEFPYSVGFIIRITY
jgi:tetratricopeptide (TPR) repeat protein